MLIDELNRRAVECLLADAERAMALVNIEDIRGSLGLVADTMRIVRRNYSDLVRRSQPLRMSEEEEACFDAALDYLRAALRLYGGQFNGAGQ